MRYFAQPPCPVDVLLKLSEIRIITVSCTVVAKLPFRGTKSTSKLSARVPSPHDIIIHNSDSSCDERNDDDLNTVPKLRGLLSTTVPDIELLSSSRSLCC